MKNQMIWLTWTYRVLNISFDLSRIQDIGNIVIFLNWKRSKNKRKKATAFLLFWFSFLFLFCSINVWNRNSYSFLFGGCKYLKSNWMTPNFRYTFLSSIAFMRKVAQREGEKKNTKWNIHLVSDDLFRFIFVIIIWMMNDADLFYLCFCTKAIYTIFEGNMEYTR